MHKYSSKPYEKLTNSLCYDIILPMSMPHEMMPIFGHEEITPLPSEKVLGPDEQVQIGLDVPLTDSQEMHRRLGLCGNLVAIIDAGGKSFFIVDTRNGNSNRDFFIADETFSIADGVGFKGIQEDKTVVIGRRHYNDRFSYPATISGNHFEIFYSNESLFVRNLYPTNETILTAHIASESRPKGLLHRYTVEDDRTHNVEDRMQAHPNFGDKDATAPYGYYMNHPILGRASKSVDGGVYLGGSDREAIVVDGKSIVMKQIYEAVASELRQPFERNETLPIQAVLMRVMSKVQEVMPYDSRKTEDISRQHHGDKLIGLSTYVKERAGVCRHQGLLAAYIIESLIKDGQMSGAVGVERNTVEDMGGTHAWAVYKSRNNGAEEVIVVDPAQSFVGTKAQAQREGRWEYRLTTDKY